MVTVYIIGALAAAGGSYYAYQKLKQYVSAVLISLLLIFLLYISSNA